MNSLVAQRPGTVLQIFVAGSLAMLAYFALCFTLVAQVDAKFGRVKLTFNLRHVMLERLNGTNEQNLKLVISPSVDPLSKNGSVELARVHIKGISSLLDLFMGPSKIRATVNITRRQVTFNTDFNVTEPDQKVCIQLRLQSQASQALIATSTLCDYVSKWLFKPNAASLQFRLHTVATNFTSKVTKNAYYVMLVATMKITCASNYYGCDCSRYCREQNNTYCDNMGRRKCLFGFYPNEGVECLIDRNGTGILTMTSAKKACSIQCRMGGNNILLCDQCGKVALCNLGYEPDIKRMTCIRKICKNDSCTSDSYCSPKMVPDFETGGFYSCVEKQTTTVSFNLTSSTRKITETPTSTMENSTLSSSIVPWNETSFIYGNETLYKTQKSSFATRKTCIITTTVLLVLCLFTVTIWKSYNILVKKRRTTEDRLVVKASSIQDFEPSCSIENPNYRDNAHRE